MGERETDKLQFKWHIDYKSYTLTVWLAFVLLHYLLTIQLPSSMLCLLSLFFSTVKMNCLICGFHKLHDTAWLHTHSELTCALCNWNNEKDQETYRKYIWIVIYWWRWERRKKHDSTLYLYLIIDTHQKTGDINAHGL